jgi:pyruvate dehydrogenase (quinone)
MPEKIASELLVERLIAWDVDTVFGLPGDWINGTKHPARAADRRPRSRR